MCSGVLIHSGDNNQDFRNRGSFLKSLPLFSMAVVVCLFCLCGFPFSSGFFSKDYILDGANLRFFIFVLFLFGVILTFSYSLRFSFYLILDLSKFRAKILSLYENVFYLFIPI